MSHRACLLNDNLDGTMSVVGKRKTSDPGSGRMPPIVISRNRIDVATAPPKASPQRPGRRRKPAKKDQVAGNPGNHLPQSVGDKEGPYCVSRFSTSSSDLPRDLSRDLPTTVDTTSTGNSSRDPVTVTVPDVAPFTPEDAEGSDDEGDSSSDTDMLFSPETARHSPGYKTALPARMAGKARMVSIRKANRVISPVKTKRRSSIRRLAAKLGAKAARREVAVYKPSEDPVPEDQHEGNDEQQNKNAATDSISSGTTRRSRRLIEKEQEQPQQESRRGAAPSNSRLRKKDNRESSSSPGRSKKGQPDSKAVSQASASGGSGGSIPPLSMKMADWEIAPGRIRVGTGGAADSK